MCCPLFHGIPTMWGALRVWWRTKDDTDSRWLSHMSDQTLPGGY